MGAGAGGAGPAGEAPPLPGAERETAGSGLTPAARGGTMSLGAAGR